ncbi:autoinducer binding domain-containing protein [Pseudomonas sp. Z6-14]|uniref:autoinducer binding domain-containing protein n=1 Tax=Pseudomonas sp. Z6-14 TaxID=2817416 RepID=UPI003DA833B7
MDEHNSPVCSRNQAGRTAPLTAFMSLAKDANRCDWERLLNKVLRQLGFGSYPISLGPAAPRDTDPLAGLITTFPKRWLEHYRGDGLIEIDPILRHCRRELLPFFWDSERRRARGRSRHFWQQREQHGLRSGLSIPLRYELLRGTLSVAFDDTQITEQEGFSNPAVYQLFMLIPYLLAGMRHQL